MQEWRKEVKNLFSKVFFLNFLFSLAGNNLAILYTLGDEGFRQSIIVIFYVPNCVLGLWTSRSGRISVCREEVRVINWKKGGVLYIDSFVGNLYCHFIILWFIGGGCNEKS